MGKTSMNSLDEKIKTYHTNPAGIKDETDLQIICTQCGSKNVTSKNEKEHYIKICQDCKNEWYVNHCWNCFENIDSRDPQNPKCPECDWCGIHPVSYRDSAYSLCESCYDQLFDD